MMDLDIPAGLSDAALLALVIGFFQPVVLNLIIQSKWSSRAQALVAFLFSVVVGTLVAYFAGAFNGVGVVTVILIVLVTSISFYRGFWKQATPELKAATDVDKPGKHEL